MKIKKKFRLIITSMLIASMMSAIPASVCAESEEELNQTGTLEAESYAYDLNKRTDKYSVTIDGITYRRDEDNKQVVGVFDSDRNIAKANIKSKVKMGDGKTYPVTYIMQEAFYGNKNLTSVKIPASMITISYCAFADTGLKEITIPSNVTRVWGSCVGYKYDPEVEDLVKIEDFVIKGVLGSEAENYAKKNGFKFIGITEPKDSKKEESKNTLSKVKITKISTGKKKFSVKWKKASAKEQREFTGYQVQYSTSKKFKKNCKIRKVSKKKAQATIKKLKSNKTYYVRVRKYKKSGKAKTYSKWTKAKKVRTGRNGVKFTLKSNYPAIDFSSVLNPVDLDSLRELLLEY